MSEMTGDSYPKFRNDHAVPEIRIGVKAFNCIGASTGAGPIGCRRQANL
jgi:hypothetical protein